MKKQSKLISSTFYYTLSNIFPQFIGFILLPLYSKYLSPEQYGIVGAMQTLQLFLAIFYSLAFERSVYRLYWDYKTDNEKGTFLGTISISIFAFSSISVLLIFISKNIISLTFKDIPFTPYFIYAILSQYFLSIFGISKSYLRLNNKALTYFLLSLSLLLVNTGFVLFFLLYQKKEADGVLLARLISTIILFPFYFYIFLKNIPLRYSFTMMRNIFAFSIPMVISIIAGWFISQYDKVIVANYVSIKDLGYYFFAKKIGSIIVIFSSSFLMAYHPLFFEIADKNTTEHKNKLKLVNNLFIQGIFFISFVLVLFMNDIFHLLINDKYSYSLIILPVIIGTNVIGAITSVVFGASLQQMKQTKNDMIFALIGSIISLIVAYLFIPKYGLWGAVVGVLFSTVSLFSMNYLFVKKKGYYIPILFKKHTFNIIIYCLILVIASKLNFSILNIFIKVLLSLIVGYLTIDIKILNVFLKFNKAE